jgi:hypothetical protein
MPYFHATWRRHLPSILKHGLGGALPDVQNFPVESGVYLALDPAIAVMMLIEAYMENGEAMGLTPPEALEAMCVIVIDDSRLKPNLLDADPNVERQDATALYRGVVDVVSMPILPVDTLFPPGSMSGEEAEEALGLNKSAG